MKKVKILLADDHEVIREGLRAILEKNAHYTVVAEAATGREVLDLVPVVKPDLVIMDISMPVMNGMDAAQELKKSFPEVKVIMLSMHNDAAYIGQCMEYDVMGFVIKSEGSKEVLRAIEYALAGKKFYSHAVTNTILENYTKQRSVQSEREVAVELTAREREIMNYIAKGLTNQKIADTLFISFRTVETHRANLMKKLDVKNSVELVNKARELKLID